VDYYSTGQWKRLSRSVKERDGMQCQICGGSGLHRCAPQRNKWIVPRRFFRFRVNSRSAQVFEERGNGLIVQGGSSSYDKDDRSPYLSKERAQELLACRLQ
jgi:hypothetical protein